jgi:hypothetical protein
LVRPVKPADNRASTAFRVRVTTAERAALDAKAAAAGTTTSDIVRAAALGWQLPSTPVTRAMLDELLAVGHKLDRIARRLKATGEYDMSELLEALAHHKQLNGQLRAVLLHAVGLGPAPE